MRAEVNGKAGLEARPGGDLWGQQEQPHRAGQGVEDAGGPLLPTPSNCWPYRSPY